MASEAVVVGGGPGGVRAAAALASSGRSVVLLQEGPLPGGLAHADIPIGRGLTPRPGALGERMLGPFAVAEGLDRAIVQKRKVRPLPLKRSAVPMVLPSAQIAPAALAWARTRGTVELKKLIGGGSEQRTYADWIAQRHGQPVFERLFAAYCRKRFGEPGDLSCNVARLFHGFPEEGPLFATARALPSLDGVEVRTNVELRAIRGGVVESDDGRFEGEVFVDLPPARMASWLEPGVVESLRCHLEGLRARHAIQVLLRGVAELPFETHVLDESVPFYRVVRPGLLPGSGGLDGTLCVHFVAEADDASADAEWVARAAEGLAAMGVEGVATEGARVQRIPWQHPVWSGTHLVKMRTWLLALEELEITPVGRGGLHSPLTLAAEMAWLEGILAEERLPLRELARVHVEPPVMDPVVRTRLTRFVER